METPASEPVASTPAEWELIERLAKLVGTYPQEVSQHSEPCDDALIAYYRNGLARDEATVGAGTTLSEVCDKAASLIRDVPEPHVANDAGREALHMWAVTLAYQAEERGNIGRVVARYARLEDDSPNIEADQHIVTEKLANDRVKNDTRASFLSDAVTALEAQAASGK